MNIGLFPGFQLNAETPILANLGIQVLTASGNFVTLTDDFELIAIGGGAAGRGGIGAGGGGAQLIKRVTGLAVGTTCSALIGAAGVTDGASGGTTSIIVPGIQTLISEGGVSWASGGSTVARPLASGGDINIPGSGGTSYQTDAGSLGGNSLLGFGATRNGVGQTQDATGYGSGGAAGAAAGNFTPGTPGIVVVRYFFR